MSNSASKRRFSRQSLRFPPPLLHQHRSSVGAGYRRGVPRKSKGKNRKKSVFFGGLWIASEAPVSVCRPAYIWVVRGRLTTLSGNFVATAHFPTPCFASIFFRQTAG